MVVVVGLSFVWVVRLGFLLCFVGFFPPFSFRFVCFHIPSLADLTTGWKDAVLLAVPALPAAPAPLRSRRQLPRRRYAQSAGGAWARGSADLTGCLFTGG